MPSTRYRSWAAAALLSLVAIHAEAGNGSRALPEKTAATVVSEGRSGWDAVGGKVQESTVAAPSAADRHQARKREMVRRMFMVMVAYR